jgi:hypothetical protein
MASDSQPIDLHNSTVEKALWRQMTMDNRLKYKTVMASDGSYWNIYPFVRLSDGKIPWNTESACPPTRSKH